jgi:hypothetical protein
MLTVPRKVILAIIAAALNIVANGRSLREILYSIALAIVLIIAVSNRGSAHRL